jgi:LPXTG-motif cell wall-anchored protein
VFSAPSASSTPAPTSSASGTVQSQGVQAPATQPSNPSSQVDPTVTQAATGGKGGKGDPGTGCSEDSFLGSAFPAAGTTVKPGDLVGANYQDESPLNTAPGFQVIFTLDGVAAPYTTAPGPKGKEKYSTLIQYQLPASISGGVHTVFLKAWDGDQNKAGGDCGTATWTFTVVTPERGIMVVKSGATLAHEGDTVTYSFAVTNTGKADLFNVTVDDDVLGHIGTIASLPVGSTQTLTKAFVVPVGKADIVNTVTACGQDASNTQVCDTDHHKLHPIHPAIALVKTADPVSVNPGATVTYTYKVTNTGDVDLTNVTVDDDVLGHIGTLPSLATGASQTLKKAVTITATSKTHNVATADGTDPLGKHVSAQADATITVVLGEQLTQPLPRTGAFVALEAMAGMALLAGGGAVLLLRRRAGARAQ